MPLTDLPKMQCHVCRDVINSSDLGPLNRMLSQFWRRCSSNVVLHRRSLGIIQLLVCLSLISVFKQTGPPDWWVERPVAVVEGRIDVVEEVPYYQECSISLNVRLRPLNTGECGM